MPDDKDFQGVSEIGKIFNSFVEKGLLCEFFLDSTLTFIQASKGYLFLSGHEDKLWLECSSDGAKKCPSKIQEEAQEFFRKGKPVQRAKGLFIPLLVRNTEIGMAVFEKETGVFSEKEMTMANDLSHQLAAALKNILLVEQTVRMERLAAIGQTMGMVLHEIKNVIQLARFGEEYLRLGLEKENKKYLERGAEGIRKAIKEMDGFTYEVLSLTKDYKIQPEAVELKTLFEELKTDLSGRAEQYRVKLEFETDAALGTVEMESRSMYRSLLNLIKNAMEAADTAKPQSYIRVSAVSKNADDYEISVEDNGLGMPEEVKAKVFQAFFSTKGEKGTGLGLLVIERTVKAHGGKVNVESEAQKGTKFILTLPKVLPKN